MIKLIIKITWTKYETKNETRVQYLKKSLIHLEGLNDQEIFFM